MRPTPVFESRSLGFTSDLSLLAPIRPGLVPAPESVTYATRARRLLQLLHGGRTRAHEASYARLLSDAVERVGVIQSVRVAVLEGENKILLTVSFDGNWQSYIRVLWQKVGALLDVIFCNTVDYPLARLSHYGEWATWVHGVQVETHFFYGSVDGTAHDLLVLRRAERQRIRAEQTFADHLTQRLAPAEQRAVDVLRGRDAAVDEDLWPGHARMTGGLLEQGLASLAGLYRLTDLYPPGTADGETLLRAAHELLLEFVQAWDNGLFKSAWAHPSAALAERFARPVDWLTSKPPAERVPASWPDWPTPDKLSDVQGGILAGYTHITHGALVLLAFDDPAAAGAFLLAIEGRLTTADQSHDGLEQPLFANLALSAEGLRRLAVCDRDWELLPEAFRQGMAARAGQLGDVNANHPDRWNPPVELGAVHAVLQLRCRVQDVPADAPWDATRANPLAREIQALRATAGIRVLSVQPMRRLTRLQDGQPEIVEHFGYADGNGQPAVRTAAQPADYPGNNVPLGDVLLGHSDSGSILIDGKPTPKADWLCNSSYLALRRYRQHVDRFDAMLAEQSRQLQVEPEELAAKLMGRDRLGRSLVALNRPPPERNRFTYRADPDGRSCPLHAHVRRANPRKPDTEPGAPQARVMRRSMSFGPARHEAGPEAERGLYFMAYGANLAEQFETVQRWLAGGNSTGATSEPSCPIVGVPRAGQRRAFGFVSQDGRALRAELDSGGRLTEDAQPLTELQWGLYLLVPSRATLRHLAQAALAAGPARPWTVEHGRAQLQALRRQLPGVPVPETRADNRRRWKAALEDADALDRWDSAALWSAVRADHGGALRTRHGVLVGGHAAVMRVLQAPAQAVTVDGYARAMKASLGPIYLGLDDLGPSSRYHQEADPVNRAIGELKVDDVYALARDVVRDRIDARVAQARVQAEISGAAHLECLLDLRDLADELLARLCEAWFGLSEAGGHLRRGPVDWNWKVGQAPLYPGHFMAPSRHIFQPWPEAQVVLRGRQHGRALRQALARFLQPHLQQGTVPQDPLAQQPAPVAQAIVRHPLAQGDVDFAARAMAGAVMGFVPTLDGALRAVAQAWQRDETLWLLRGRHGHAGALERATAEELIGPALAEALAGRSVPDLIWREARAPFELRPGLTVQPGEKLVLGLGSAAHEAWEQGRPDPYVMFGGRRSGAGHPTHACPGYDVAQAAMLGFWSALVQHPEAWRPVQGSAALKLERPGSEPVAAPPAASPAARGVAAPQAAPRPLALGRPLAPQARDARALVMCWGDSWVDYRQGGIGKRIDLSVALQGVDGGQRYRVDRSFADFNDWGHLELLSKGVDRFVRELRELVAIGDVPRVILISGGGNDSTMPELRGLMPATPVNQRPVFDPQKVETHVATLMGYYDAVLSRLQAEHGDPSDPLPTIPVLLHGYDHPHPGTGISPWLWPAFRDICSPAEAAQDMAWLIDAFNRGLKDVAARYPTYARYVRLTGVLAAEAHPKPAASLWENELHPNGRGFQLLAARLDAAIRQLPPA